MKLVLVMFNCGNKDMKDTKVNKNILIVNWIINKKRTEIVAFTPPLF